MRVNATRLALVFGALVLWVSPALAQRPGGFFGGMGMGGVGLLRNKSVQQELKLDDAQAEKATKLAEETMAKRREQFQQLRDLSDDERRTKMEAMRKTAAEEDKKALKDLLSSEQRKRLEQIELQQRGPGAFADPEVQAKLKLTAEQTEQLRGVLEGYREESREIFQNSQGNFQEAREKLTALRKAKTEKAVALLNDDQKKTWNDLLGSPFEIKFDGPGGR